MRRLVSRSCVVGVVILGVCAPGAWAGWGKPAVLVDGDDAALLGAVVRPDGSLRTAISDRPHGVGLGLVDAAAPPAAFGAPLVALAAPAMVGPVALAGDGSGVAVRFEQRAPSSVLAFDAAGTFQPPVALDDVGGTTAAVSPAGAAVVAWVAKAGKSFAVDAMIRDPGTAAFGAPVRVGYTATANSLLDAGIGDRGEAVVSWQVNGFPSKVAAAVRLPGAGFGKATFVSSGATDAKLAVGPGGQAIMVTGYEHRLEVSVKPPGAATMPAARRLDHDAEGFAAGVAADGPRQVAVVWLAAPKLRAKAHVHVYAGAAGAKGPRPIGTLGTDATGDSVSVAVDPAGATAVSWMEALKPLRGHSSARSHLAVSYRAAGRRFGPTTTMGPVSLDDTPEGLVLGPGGRAYVLYEAFEPGDDGGDSYRRVYVAERRP